MKQLNLPELPDGMEWVVHAEPDRFTISLSYARPQEINPDVDNEFDTKSSGYVMSHTHRHPTVITRATWDEEVTNAAKHLWTAYTEGNNHAKWADELMRRSR